MIRARASHTHTQTHTRTHTRTEGEKDADLFAEYVYAKGAPGWKKKGRDETANCLTSSTLPRIVFSLVYDVRSRMCTETWEGSLVLPIFTFSFSRANLEQKSDF